MCIRDRTTTDDAEGEIIKSSYKIPSDENIVKMINYDSGEYTNVTTGENYSVTYLILEYFESGDLFSFI